MNKDQALDKIEQLAYSYDKGTIESMREGISAILDTLLTGTAERQREACAEYYKSNCKDFDGYVYEVILHTPLNQTTKE